MRKLLLLSLLLTGTAGAAESGFTPITDEERTHRRDTQERELAGNEFYCRKESTYSSIFGPQLDEDMYTACMKAMGQPVDH